MSTFLKKYIIINLFISISFLSLSCKKEDLKEEQIDTNIIDNIPLDTNSNTIAKDYFLTLEVTNIKSIEGNINIAVFNSEDAFKNSNNWYFAEKYTISNDTLLIKIKNLPKNYYAISIYHDKNSNDILDKSLLGIPQEGFGFSNNAMGTFGPPTYEQAKIYIDTLINTNTSIRLIYY